MGSTEDCGREPSKWRNRTPPCRPQALSGVSVESGGWLPGEYIAK